MTQVLRRHRALPAMLVAGAAALLALGGCQVRDESGNQVKGKQLFIAKCGACHTLAHASTKGTQGPNLDQAFIRDRHDGIPTDTIRGVVYQQILYPNRGGIMPAKLYTGQEARDVASYVAAVAGHGGKDSGALAAVGQSSQKKNVAAQGGKLEIDADPSGQLLFTVANATAGAGSLTITMKNASATPHDLVLQGTPGKTPVISGGKSASFTVSLKPGTYTFFCSVPGHRQAGMQGTIKVS
jgi:uncharacterized cupredoxin-like copper-binding protein